MSWFKKEPLREISDEDAKPEVLAYYGFTPHYIAEMLNLPVSQVARIQGRALMDGTLIVGKSK